MSAAGVVFLASLPIPIVASLYWHWKVMGLYRSLGDRVKEISYYWFSFQFQNPSFASQLPGYVDVLKGLPEDQAAKVVLIRRQARYATATAACWGLLFVFLIAVSFTT
jgi:hypothetical protein